MNMLLRKTLTGAVAAVSLGAMVAATTTPASAWGYGRHFGGWGGGGAVAAGVIGGLALGAIAAGASRPAYAEPAYDAPVYGAPVYAPPAAYVEADPYGPSCHREVRPVYRADGAYLRDRLVRVCD